MKLNFNEYIVRFSNGDFCRHSVNQDVIDAFLNTVEQKQLFELLTISEFLSKYIHPSKEIFHHVSVAGVIPVQTNDSMLFFELPNTTLLLRNASYGVYDWYNNYKVEILVDQPNEFEIELAIFDPMKRYGDTKAILRDEVSDIINIIKVSEFDLKKMVKKDIEEMISVLSTQLFIFDNSALKLFDFNVDEFIIYNLLYGSQHIKQQIFRYRYYNEGLLVFENLYNIVYKHNISSKQRKMLLDVLLINFKMFLIEYNVDQTNINFDKLYTDDYRDLF